MNKILKDKKNIVVLLLLLLFLVKAARLESRFIFWVGAGVFICSAADFIINKVFLGKNILPSSAIISGFIVSGILDYRQGWHCLLIFCLLPVLSKHIVRVRNKHIFNPANLSLFVATLFKIPLAWNIESNIPLIVVVGLYLAYAYKKLPHILGFLASFCALFALFKINPLGLVSWFFIFIMLIEPKTSGYGVKRGLLFGGICGIVSFLCFRFVAAYDPFVTSLFFANLFNPLLDRFFPKG